MRNILKIHIRDLTRISRNVMALIVAVGLCILPALYAWFNIIANWDPYGSTSGIKVAVASNDEGAEIRGVHTNIGERIVDKLRSNNQIGWQFTDSETAMEGVLSGEYYAAVIIPEGFSEQFTSVFFSEAEHPHIQYYVNEKKNAIAPKITDKGVSALQQQVNSTFITVATEAISAILGTAVDEFGEDGNKLVDGFVRELKEADSMLADLEVTLDLLLTTTDSLDVLIGTGKILLPQTDTLARNIDASLDDAHKAVKDIDKMMATMDDILDLTFELIGVMGDATIVASDSVNNLASNSAILIDLSNNIIEINNDLIPIFDDLASNPSIAMNTTTAAQMAGALRDMNESQKNIQNGISTGAINGKKLASDMKSTGRQMKNVSNSYASSPAQLSGNTKNIDATLDSLGAVTHTLAGSLDTIGETLDKLSASVTATRQTLEQTQKLLGSTRSRMGRIIDRLNDVPESEMLNEFISLIQNDPEALGSFMSSPVEVETNVLYGIANYGSAMTPFYTTLALWVGATILVAVLRVHVDEDENIKNITPGQSYLGRFLLFMLLGLIQATIICMGDLYFLQIQCLHPLLFFVAGWVSSFVYTMLIYTLTVSFGDVGKAIAVILLVVQVAGSGGTFPIEVTPQFFQNVYPFLPFTHSINAMRETVAGMYEWKFAAELLMLCLYIPVSLILGLLLRRVWIRMTEFFEERLEDTNLM